ncbi:MAG: proprotein convertase P-domain-containing protein [Akkermansiaceae bacterium]|nr:proprotein convertase P-domain-containing protein [Akkermansiaceae bacterium]
MKLPPLLLTALFVPAAVHAAGSAITLTPSWSGTLVVPDNDALGASSAITITALGLDRIESVTMQLEIDGGWNGDLYGYLVHDGQLSILMNRPGKTLANPGGFGSTGMNVTFSDLAAGDIHMALPDSGVATGFFQPDGRLTDPLDVLDTDARAALLSVFTNENPNGVWTLFLADQGPGDTSTLKSWSLSVTAVPEPAAALMLGVTAMAMAAARRRGA